MVGFRPVFLRNAVHPLLPSFLLILFMLVKSTLCKIKVYKYKDIPGILGTLFEIFQNVLNIHFVHRQKF